MLDLFPVQETHRIPFVVFQLDQFSVRVHQRPAIKPRDQGCVRQLPSDGKMKASALLEVRKRSGMDRFLPYRFIWPNSQWKITMFRWLNQLFLWQCSIAMLNSHIGSIPIGSMYAIYANIGGILMVNVAIYSIHGSYGIGYSSYCLNHE